MKAYCLNNISPVALNGLKNNDVTVDDINQADSILVRSAKMHDMDLENNILAVARAGAGVNNIPLDKYAEQGIVVFNTPGANANAVKELVLCGLLLSCRDIIGGVKYIENNSSDENIAASAEKAKAKAKEAEQKAKQREKERLAKAKADALAKEKERAKKTEKILEWIQEHSSFCEGFGDDRATLTVKEIAQQMKAHQIKVDFTAKELCKVLQKGSL